MGCTGSKNAAGDGKGGAGEANRKRSTKPGAFSAEDFIFENTGKIHDYYNFEDKKLGQGTYGTTSTSTSTSTTIYINWFVSTTSILTLGQLYLVLLQSLLVLVYLNEEKKSLQEKKGTTR